MPVNSNKLTKQIMIEVFGAVEIDKNTVMIDSSNIFKFVSRSTKPNDDGGFGTYAGQHIPSVSYLKGVSFTYNVKEDKIESDIPNSEYKEVIKNAIWGGIRLVRAKKDAKPALHMEHWDDVQKLELSEKEEDLTMSKKETNAIEAVKEIDEEGKISGKNFRLVSSVAKVTTNKNVINVIAGSPQVSWTILNREDLDIDELFKVFIKSGAEARFQLLRSSYGIDLYKTNLELYGHDSNLNSTDLVALIGNNSIGYEMHKHLKDKHWDRNKLLFIDSHLLSNEDIFEISEHALNCSTEHIVNIIHVNKLSSGNVWHRLLSEKEYPPEIYYQLFELKDYYLDMEIMNNTKTPEDLKDTIRDIMDKHHKQLLN